VGDGLVTAGILAVVALSEGVRRLAPGALVLQRWAFGRWRVAHTFELGSGMHLLSWCIPWSLPLILSEPPAGDTLSRRRLVTRLRARARRVRMDLALLRVLGLLVLVTLVVGVPVATARHGAWGLIASLQMLLLLAIAQATFTWIALRRAGARRGVGAAAAKMLWPFNSQLAPQLVQSQVAAGVPKLVAAQELMGDDELLRAMRRDVYDAVNGFGGSDLLSLYDRAQLRGFLALPVAAPGQPHCPRCGTQYQPDVAACADCDGVALVA